MSYSLAEDVIVGSAATSSKTQPKEMTQAKDAVVAIFPRMLLPDEALGLYSFNTDDLVALTSATDDESKRWNILTEGSGLESYPGCFRIQNAANRKCMGTRGRAFADGVSIILTDKQEEILWFFQIELSQLGVKRIHGFFPSTNGNFAQEKRRALAMSLKLPKQITNNDSAIELETPKFVAAVTQEWVLPLINA